MKKIASIPIIHLTKTSSTSTYLKSICSAIRLAEFTTVVSEFQTTGHGQANNSWESEDGKNILFSFVLYPNFCPANKQFHLSQLISLSIMEELQSFAKDFSIKWPNDIYWQDKKICGILIENELFGEMMQRCIAGIGININQTAFHSDAPNPVSLAQIIGREEDKRAILNSIMKRVKDYYELYKSGEVKTITERYFNALYRKDGFHRYKDNDGYFNARIADILPLGTLILEDEQGKKRAYNFKEVSFVKDE